MTDPDGPRDFRSLAFQALSLIGRAPALIARAAWLPVLVVFAVVYGAGRVAAPWATVLDVLHAAVALSYLTALARIAMGTFPGLCVWGLAVPRPVWPGVKAALAIAGEALVLMLPTAVILFAVGQYAIVPISQLDSALLNAVLVVAAQFVLLTELGLVIGAGLQRHGPARD